MCYGTLDCRAGSSYVCIKILKKINIEPIRREKETVKHQKNVKIFIIKLPSLLLEDFTIKIKFANAEMDILTYLSNVNIRKVKKRDS